MIRFFQSIKDSFLWLAFGIVLFISYTKNGKPRKYTLTNNDVDALSSGNMRELHRFERNTP